MRLLVQRVSRASAEVNGASQARIGYGLVLTLGLARGDTPKAAEQLAAKVLGVNLFPELMDPDALWRTNVIDNGGEILVLLQQTLCMAFSGASPSLESALPLMEATPIFDAFVAKLRDGYQEEMVVPVVPGASPASSRIELVCDGSSIFELCGPSPAVTATAKAKAQKGAGLVVGDDEPLKAEVGVVTRFLRRLPTLPRSRIASEVARLVRVLGVPQLRSSLAEAPQQEADAFAEALDTAAHLFTAKQQEQIMEWTGLTISAEPADEAGGSGADGRGDMSDDLERQLAELKEEVEDPLKGIVAARRRRGQEAGVVRSDATGRAAPDTPAVAEAARQWAANRRAARESYNSGAVAGTTPQASWGWSGGGKGKAGGKGVRPPRRNWGICSLDESSRLHGAGSGNFAYGQQTEAYFEKAAAGGASGEPAAKRPRELPKGTPTVAPMCPAPGDTPTEDL